MRRHWVKIVLAAVALAVLVLVALPFFINADTFRPMLEEQLSNALGRRVTLSHLSFSLISGSLVANNIAIADDPAFSTSPFLQARSFHIGVEVMPLIFHRQVHVTDLKVDSPAIRLIQAQNGKWNFSSIGGAAAGPASSQPGAIPNFTVGALAINDGSVTVSSLPATGKPFVYSKVNLEVHQFSLAKSFPFQLSASLPGQGTLQLSGAAGPLAKEDASNTPFHASLEVKHLDPVAAGLVDPSKGISMVADINANVQSNGSTTVSTGKIVAAHLQLARTGSPAPQPVHIDYSISNNLDARTGQISDLAIHTGAVTVHVTGGYRLTPQAVVLDLRLAAPSLPVDQLEALLPAFGVQLPSGSSLHGGTLTADLAISGPATAATITGPVELDNTQLAGFNLGSSIQGLNPLGGTSGGTAIQTLRANVNSSPQISRFSNILASVPAIGTATGSGSVSPSGALNFNLTAKLNTSSGIGALANQAANSVGGFFGQFLHRTVNNGVPLTVTGTAAHPRIHANLGAMLR